MPKKKASRKSNPDIAEQIAAAVAQIPDMVAPEYTAPHEDTPPLWQSVDPHHGQKKLWLWSGVSIFVAAIVILWGISTRAFFTDVREKGFPEKLLLERIKADTESIVTSIESTADLQTITRERQTRVDNAEAALATALRSIIDGAEAATASTTANTTVTGTADQPSIQ